MPILLSAACPRSSVVVPIPWVAGMPMVISAAAFYLSGF